MKNKLLNLLFGWLTKGYCEASILDGLMALIEFSIILILIYEIKTFFEFLKNRKEKDDEK